MTAPDISARISPMSMPPQIMIGRMIIPAPNPIDACTTAAIRIAKIAKMS